MEPEINHVSNAFIAVYLASMLLTLWKAIKQHFPFYWVFVFALLALGAATVMSPAYLPIPVQYWDRVVSAGNYMLLGVSSGYSVDVS
ncbi:hypothetical protein [Ensifer aridi]|uniref:hypothetical protein n=1 Tax=Ensifer aridi TaxID=1708715 RepID=UPI0009C156FF|nr:hypothetical protein [Ensifer aridi]